MNKKETLLVFGSLFFFIGVAYIAIREAFLKDEENQKLQQNNLKMLIKIAEDEKKFNTFVAEQIEKTIESLMNQKIDTNIIKELQEALELYKMEKTGDALLPIVKILEHLLSVCYKNNENCSKWLRAKGKKSGFKGWLDFCYYEKKISEEQYNLLDQVRELRNRKTHDLAFYRAPEELEKAIVISVNGIGNLLYLAYPQITIKNEKQN